MRCLRHIARIKWQDKIPNTEVLKRRKISGIEAFIIRAQVHWVSHVRRISGFHQKATFYAELPSGIRPNCRPLLHFKGILKDNLLLTGTDPTTWQDLADNRSKWQKACITGVLHFEVVRITTAVEKRR